MKRIVTVKQLQRHLVKLNISPVGFVPTMGALHDGHISLVRNATKKCPVVIVSIYVNPNQFNDLEDLKNYPRTIEADLLLLKDHLRKDDVVFTPDDKEIYPVKDERVFTFGNLDHVMEALHRPGHFNGVAQVVSRLFDIVRPDIAYFGIKDFQQVAVIRSMVRHLNLKIRISACPIVRESDGLAMSSRNRLLEKGMRKNASVIYRTISKAAGMIRNKEIPEIRKFVKTSIEKVSGFRVEYFEIADETDLIPVRKKAEMKEDSRYFGCIAVKAGKIRLIDNIEFPLA